MYDIIRVDDCKLCSFRACQMCGVLIIVKQYLRIRAMAVAWWNGR